MRALRALRRRAPGWAWGVGAAGAAVAAAALALVLTPVGRWSVQWSYGPEWDAMDGTARSHALGQFRLAVVQAAGFLGAGAALVFTGFGYRLSRRGQVTDRFTKALERLGSAELHVRVGGVLALERFVRDSPEQAAHAARVLNAFVRSRAPRARPRSRPPDARGGAEGAAALRAALGVRPGTGAARPHEGPADDVQAALTALAHPASRRHIPPDVTLDLSGLDLAGAVLDGLDLAGARLIDADLDGARLSGAILTGAWLQGARLTRARLEEANLRYAQLDRADLSGALLIRADLTSAWLDHAVLAGAHLREASLARAQLHKADLGHARLNEADLTGAQFRDADLTAADLLRADLTGACVHGDLRRAVLLCAGLADAWLDGADLREAEGLTAEQLTAACPTALTRLPPELAADPGVAARVAAVSAWGTRWDVVTVAVTFTPRTAGGRALPGERVLAFERAAVVTGPGFRAADGGRPRGRPG